MRECEEGLATNLSDRISWQAPWSCYTSFVTTFFIPNYPELLPSHIDSSFRSSCLWLNPYDILTPSSVSFTALYCRAQSAQSPFRLFFSRLLSFTDHETLCLTHNLQTIYYINSRVNAVFFSFDLGNLPSSLLIERSPTKYLEEDLTHQNAWSTLKRDKDQYHIPTLQRGYDRIEQTDRVRLAIVT